MNKIAAAINKKVAGGTITCPVCQTKNWNMVQDLVRLTLQPNPATVALTGISLPLVAITCSNCGNTQLLNVLVLGLGEMFGIKPGGSVVPESGGKSNG